MSKAEKLAAKILGGKSDRDRMTNRYELIIYWSKEDDSFIVEVPELPGCMADGQTYAEAVANAEEIISEWIETARKLGRPIPEPRGKLAYA
jgi:predicted RNase H-like HicB family nuclease